MLQPMHVLQVGSSSSTYFYFGVALEAAQLPKTYPIQLGLAYLLLVGYAVRTLFVSLSLPASVGVIISGWIFSYFIQDDIFFGRDMLQELSFFLVLLTAGLGISLPSLKWQHFVVALLPCTLELLAIMAYATTYLGYTLAEGLNLGTVLVAVGDGLVIPKMKEFHAKFPHHPMPYLMLCWAPLEACYVLALFGVFTSVSAPASMPDINFIFQISWTVLRVLATVCGGALMGFAAGCAIRYRGKVMYDDRPVFNDSAVESFLILLGIALIAYGLGGNSMSIFSMGPLFHPELMVIVTGSTFAWYCDTHHQECFKVLEQVDTAMGGVWVFGQLVLFTMIGSKTSFSIFPDVTTVLPIMAVGLLVRFVGVMASMLPMDLAAFQVPTGAADPVQRSGDGGARPSLDDAFFCFLACLPRATIQGALGAVPVNQRFFQDVPVDDRAEAREFIFTAARLYIFCYAIFGMFLLNTYGFRILERDKRYARAVMASEGAELPERPSIASPNSTVESKEVPPRSETAHPNPHRKENLRRSKSNVSSMSGKTYEVIPETPRSEQLDDQPQPGLESRSVSQNALPAAQHVSDPGPQRARFVTEPADLAPGTPSSMLKTLSIYQRMALYPFDERPPPVRMRQTSPTEGPGGPGQDRPWRRSLGHGPNLLDSSDDEQIQFELERGTGSRGARAQTWDASANPESWARRE